MDVALHRQAVTFVLDRAGVTGDDGASHNGMWDLSILRPGARAAARRAPGRRSGCASCSREAVAIEDGPTAVRFPKGNVPADIAGDRPGRRDGRAAPGRRRRTC